LIEAGNGRHEHKFKVWRNVKLPAGKILIPGVVSHAIDLVEHPELVAGRIITFVEIVDQESVIAGTTAAKPAASIRKSPGPSCAPCATARRARARSCGVEFKSACAG